MNLIDRAYFVHDVLHISATICVKLCSAYQLRVNKSFPLLNINEQNQ